MKTSLMKTILVTGVLCMVAGWLALPAQAQLPYYMDDHGNLVYTNDDSPHPRKAPAGKPLARPDLNRNNPELHAANSGPANAFGEDVLHQLVQETAHKHNVDPALVSAVISTESNWNTSAISRKGAQGLMQLVPQTAQHFGVYNPFDPTQNVEAGVKYLSTLLQRYNGDLPKTLAAYNAGPRVVDRWGGVPDFRETREYVRKVTSSYFQPGSEHHSPWRAAPRPIYRSTRDDGRVVFTNE
ncbi:MAG: lytic transglycosylase [Acidobacteria bacterium]|nr:MAG: lytic transglycosylase [Acidobacteriota bacterium]